MPNYQAQAYQAIKIAAFEPNLRIYPYLCYPECLSFRSRGNCWQERKKNREGNRIVGYYHLGDDLLIWRCHRFCCDWSEFPNVR